MLCAFILLNCTNNKTTIRKDVCFPDTLRLTSVAYDKEIIMNVPSKIELFGENIALFKINMMDVVKVYNSKDLNDVYTWSSGNGPSEFINPSFAGKDRANNLLYIYDVTTQKLSAFKNYINQDSIQDYKLIQTYNRTPTPALVINSLSILTDKYFVAKNYIGSHNALSILNKDFSVVTDFCNPLSLDRDPEFLMNGYISTYDNEIAYATSYFGYLSFYIIDSKGIPQKGWEYLLSTPVFRRDNNSKIDYSLSVMGFYDVHITDKYVFALYSGNISDGSIEELPTNVLVFNKSDGTPVVKLILDNPTVRIAVSDDSRILYSFNSAFNKIIKFSIPSLD